MEVTECGFSFANRCCREEAKGFFLGIITRAVWSFIPSVSPITPPPPQQMQIMFSSNPKTLLWRKISVMTTTWQSQGYLQHTEKERKSYQLFYSETTRSRDDWTCLFLSKKILVRCAGCASAEDEKKEKKKRWWQGFTAPAPWKLNACAEKRHKGVLSRAEEPGTFFPTHLSHPIPPPSWTRPF